MFYFFLNLFYYFSFKGGSIAVKAKQNYASYAFISKDYAKFRKETNFLQSKNNESINNNCCSISEGRSHRDDLPNKLPITTIKTVTILELLNKIDETTLSTYETETMNNEIPTEIMDSSKSTLLPNTRIDDTTLLTTSDDSIGTVSTIESSTTETTSSIDIETTISADNDDTTIHFIDFITNKINNVTEKFSPIIFESSTSSRLPSTRSQSSSTPQSSSTSFRLLSSTQPSSTPQTFKLMMEKSSMSVNTSAAPSSTTTQASTTTTTTQASTTPDIIYETNLPPIIEHDKNLVAIKVGVTGSPTSIIMPDNIFTMNVTLKTNVSIGVQPMLQGVTVNPVRPDADEIEAIVNITNRRKGQEFGEYDYSEPTLPPSLPNVR